MARNLECQYPAGSVARVPTTAATITNLPSPSVSSGDGLSSFVGEMDFNVILDDLRTGNVLDIGNIAQAQTTFSWDEFTIPSPNQFEFQSEPPTDIRVHSTSIGDIIPGKSLPPWTLGHSLYSRFTPQETQRSTARFTIVSLTERLITITLRSYPNMMQPDGVPPFIHAVHSAHEDMRTTLENCVGLVLLWKSQRGFNHRFVADSLERERSRLFSEVCMAHLLACHSTLVPWLSRI